MGKEWAKGLSLLLHTSPTEIKLAPLSSHFLVQREEEIQPPFSPVPIRKMGMNMVEMTKFSTTTFGLSVGNPRTVPLMSPVHQSGLRLAAVL